jgi:hypothetical protein
MSEAHASFYTSLIGLEFMAVSGTGEVLAEGTLCSIHVKLCGKVQNFAKLSDGKVVPITSLIHATPVPAEGSLEPSDSFGVAFERVRRWFGDYARARPGVATFEFPVGDLVEVIGLGNTTGDHSRAGKLLRELDGKVVSVASPFPDSVGVMKFRVHIRRDLAGTRFVFAPANLEGEEAA